MKETFADFLVANADVICAGFYLFSIVGILYVARRVSTPRAPDPTARDTLSRLTDGTATLEDGHTTTEWPQPVAGTTESPKARTTSGAWVVAEDKKFRRVVRIRSCRDPLMWYAKEPKGLEVPLLAVWPEGYFVRCPDGTTNIVRHEDGEITHKWGNV